MSDYDIQDKGGGEYHVTDKSTGMTFNVNILTGMGNAGNMIMLGIVTFIIAWIASIFTMPILFFTRGVYEDPACIVAYWAAWACLFLPFIAIYKKLRPDADMSRLKRVGVVAMYGVISCMYVLLTLVLVICCVPSLMEKYDYVFYFGAGVGAYVLLYYIIRDLANPNWSGKRKLIIILSKYFVLCVVLAVTIKALASSFGNGFVPLMYLLYMLSVDVPLLIGYIRHRQPPPAQEPIE